MLCLTVSREGQGGERVEGRRRVGQGHSGCDGGGGAREGKITFNNISRMGCVLMVRGSLRHARAAEMYDAVRKVVSWGAKGALHG